MNIIVVGNGKIGELLVQQLSKEGHDVVVVDSNAARIRSLEEKLDVSTVVGNGASIEILREAGAENCDILIAVSNSDEVNLLTALVAKKLGCEYTVARVRSPEYDREMNLLKTSFGINLSVNPEKTCAKEIFRLLQFPSFLTRNSFAGGRAEMVELIVPEEGKLTDRKLMELAPLLDKKALICTIERDGEVLVPSGSTELRAGDKLAVAAATADLPFLLRRFGIPTLDVKQVMIVGGSATARYLATDLINAGLSVTIVESDREKCKELEDLLPKASIIHGDGSLQHLLAEEGIANMDAVVPLTGIDEENILISLYAHSVGTKKTITKVNRTEYLNLFGQEHLGAVVSPKSLTANEITRYTRAASQSREGSVETLHTIGGGAIEALGFTVPEEASFVNKPIMELPLKPSTLIASIVRNQRVIIPGGQDCLMRGDSIVVIASAERMISNFADIFRERGGEA